MDLSIVMVNWNGKDITRDCLNSIYKYEYPFEFELFLVDNASTDGSVEILKKEFPKVNFLVNKENLGFTRANNVAFSQCTGKYIFLLNNDTIVEEGTLEKLVTFMDEHPEVGACGPRVLNADGTLQPQCRRGDLTISAAVSYVLGLHKLFPGSKFFGKYLMTWQPDNVTHEIEAASGCAFMIRREIFEEVGWLDSDYFLSGDDIDLSLRLRRAGHRIFYVHDAPLVHLKGLSVNRHKNSFNIYHMFRSQYIYYKKNWAPGRFFLVNWLAYFVIAGGYAGAMGINFIKKILDKIAPRKIED
ncbi:MAG: glycosyltransferase family 2 protein [Vulcanimicrobiota bacterium]